MGCKYEEQKYPESIVKALSALSFNCVKSKNGCLDPIPYNALYDHERYCGFRLENCSGCKKEMIEKEIKDHEAICGFVKLYCNICETYYQRQHGHDKLDCVLGRQEHV
ncbi:unnamed protein product [Didymodactylos carnosus]|uniref:TRAFD1/XAF1 zinc finger domain-containing protein n=1 Tax=Didymodactylos carnosus TaxID=1234261 RepID=A0A8S2DRT9_9BILA|nr:unnamed protein product [Didymodactylos carnosus]CAF3784983.1 unnamed protein product [Didymodactylos carnosus]